MTFKPDPIHQSVVDRIGSWRDDEKLVAHQVRIGELSAELSEAKDDLSRAEGAFATATSAYDDLRAEHAVGRADDKRLERGKADHERADEQRLAAKGKVKGLVEMLEHHERMLPRVRAEALERFDERLRTMATEAMENRA